MFRRLTSLLIVWFGLLAIIAPSVTCAAAVSRGDCCPPEGTPPCGECPDKRAPRAPEKTHCVVLPVQVVSSAVVTQVLTEKGLHPDALDVVTAIEFLTSTIDVFAELGRHLETAATPAGDAALTYLFTGRLRL